MRNLGNENFCVNENPIVEISSRLEIVKEKISKLKRVLRISPREQD